MYEEVWEGMLTFGSGDKAVSAASSGAALLPAKFLNSPIIQIFGLPEST